jgi:hypothetical protein
MEFREWNNMHHCFMLFPHFPISSDIHAIKEESKEKIISFFGRCKQKSSRE